MRSPLFSSASTLAFTLGAICAGLPSDRAAAAPTDRPAHKARPAPARPAHKPAPPPATPPAEESVAVVAQRRSQPMQDVPITLSVVTADQMLRDAQFNRTSDVVKFVPNAQAQPTEGPERPRWFIRGIGTNSTVANSVNPVGIYYDDVYIANVYNQGFPLFDLAQAEILRGPQGTLWGKNANGGAIDYISRAPEFSRSGFVKFGYGSFNHSQEQAAVGGTLIPGKVAGRFSFYADNTDGWQKNLYDGTRPGGGLDTAARGQLLITPDDDLKILLNAHFRRYEGTVLPQPYVADSTTMGGGFGNPATVYMPGYNTPQSVPHLKYDQVYTIPAPEALREYGGLSRITLTKPGYTLTSITAAETNDRTQGQSYPDLAPPPGQVPYIRSLNTGNYWQATEELHIASPKERRFLWMAGLYGFLEHLNSLNATAYYAYPVNAAGVQQPLSVPPYSNYHYDQNWKSGSAFANSSYQITKKLKASAGVRWSIEHIDIQERYYAASPASGPATGTDLRQIPGNAPLTYAPRDHNTFRNWTADFTLDYAFTRDAMAYFRFASGKMPGNYGFSGYTRVPGQTISAVQIFQLNPEAINSYELGVKSQWFGHKLTANADIFRYDYTNALVNVPTSIGSGITAVIYKNAGAALIQGAEVQLDAAPVAGLHVGSNIGILHARYTSQESPSDGILGARIPRSPHISLTGYINYNIPLPRGSVTLGGDFQLYTKQYFFTSVATQTQDDLLQQRAYSLVNAHVTWFPLKTRRLSFDASVLNVANTGYRTLSITPFNGVTAFTYGQPRSFFLQGAYQF
ncbi:TonB-dependent receptor [Gluconacetobacter takamatsuzukensis]|uniref:TonB-dependent receptor plug domain-containing protein n=1 Tax=Gluconacetobacter takamatsuzukensis TaxID=1286190 RepID=A0A7W4PRI3_9PROT|nr:TonB-dependent receptor [Gluconacetobacter takamatsuzukensis]MBB2205509.1 TonB-dependent receptor plug domain-containing protein [Gluconacetobacter takamatsuzukensis]